MSVFDFKETLEPNGFFISQVVRLFQMLHLIAFYPVENSHGSFGSVIAGFSSNRNSNEPPSCGT